MIIMKKILLSFVFFFLIGCTSETFIEISSPLTPHEGLNIFQFSAEEGIIRGAYIEGEYRVDFEGIRTGLRPFFSMLVDPSVGLYDASACYIAQNGDPFIITDACSVAPSCSPEDINCEIDDKTRTKEFELAYKASQDLMQMKFPSNMQRVQEALRRLPLDELQD